jgi:plastocyanin
MFTRICERGTEMDIRYYLLGAALCVASGCAKIPDRPQYVPANLRQASEDFVFEADPQEIQPGETTVLRWNIRGATSVTIDEASADGKLRTIGTFGAADTLKVQPREDSTYVVSCEGNAAFACASVSVRVRVKRPR